MSDPLRHKTVAVAVVYDERSKKFLLWHNKRWQGYAFPMKQFEPGDSNAAPQAALAALGEAVSPLDLTQATATPLDCIGECLFSEGVRQYTYYDYHVYGVEPGGGIDPGSLDPDLRFFSYEELVAAPNVTSSTRSIARSLVEDRKVAAAVIARAASRGREFLLVRNRNYRYFFPATRIKTDAPPAEAVVQAVRVDLGYEGEVRVVDQAQVDALQDSQRFGPRQSRFHFQVCLVDLPSGHLDAERNPLEQSLETLQGAFNRRALPAAASKYWGWFTEQEMRTEPEMSPSMPTVLGTALQLVERHR